MHTLCDVPADSETHALARVGALEEIKVQRLLDLIRRVVANPQNAEEVARAIAADWTPLWEVSAAGCVSIRLPRGA